jgi:hypothetical protein
MKKKTIFESFNNIPSMKKSLISIAPKFSFTAKNIQNNKELAEINQNENIISQKNNKEDISEDLNRLGNDWKSDPNQQEEAKIAKEEFYHPEKQKEEEIEKPEDLYIG